MDQTQLKDRIHRIEECADEALRAATTANAPNDLRQGVETMHQQARQVQQQCDSAGSQQMGQGGIRDAVVQLEQTADRAMQACRSAGNVQPQLQQAVKRAHDEISSLKKEIQMG